MEKVEIEVAFACVRWENIAAVVAVEGEEVGWNLSPRAVKDVCQENLAAVEGLGLEYVESSEVQSKTGHQLKGERIDCKVVPRTLLHIEVGHKHLEGSALNSSARYEAEERMRNRAGVLHRDGGNCRRAEVAWCKEKRQPLEIE